MTAWVASPAYGTTVFLGPAQRDVLRVALDLTRHGRRPRLTLHRLSLLSGRPVSSVHDALGRLRALGILGVSASMGRNGGHRLWRVTGRGARSLGEGKHRVAVARIIRRWYAAITEGDHEATPPADDRPRGPAGSPARPSQVVPPAGPRLVPNGSGTGRALTPDPFGVTPSDWQPGPPDESFGEKLRRYGLGPWIDERDHDATTS